MSNTTLTVQMAAAINLYDNLGAGYGGKPFTDGTAMNANAPPPNAAQLLANTNNQIMVPGAPFTVNFAWIRSPPGSTNLKTVKGISGDTGMTQSAGTTPMCLPVTAGTPFYIYSPAAETVEIVYG